MLKKIKGFFHLYHLPILSGILIGTSYIPFYPWAMFFCFVPLWTFWLRQDSMKKIFWGGWITQFILTLVGFHWVSHTIQEHAGLPLPLALIGLLLFSAFANYYIPVAGCVWFFLKKHLRLPLFMQVTLLAGLLSLGETFLHTIFPWNFGYNWLWADWIGFQVTDYIGFLGLSSFGIFLNGVLFYFWKDRRKTKKATALLALALGSFAIVNILGILREQSFKKPQNHLNVLIVQANIGNQQKLYAQKGWGYRDEIVKTYLDLTRKGLQNHSDPIDFILWPETAFPNRIKPSYPFENSLLQVKRLTKKHQTPLLMGAYYENPDTKKISNSIVTIDKNGNLQKKPYRKNILLAYGEYIPGSDTFPFLLDIFPQVANFQRGNGPQVSSVKEYNVGLQICYESLFPQFTKKLSDLGAQVIVNVTNDSWFGKHSEPYQHLYMTLARAIEFRRPVIRSTNTGISTVISPRGEIQEKSPLFKKWQDTYKVAYHKNPKNTFYQRNLWLIPGVISVILGLIIIYGTIQRLQKRE